MAPAGQGMAKRTMAGRKKQAPCWRPQEILVEVLWGPRASGAQTMMVNSYSAE
jgi:hypothetical protein